MADHVAFTVYGAAAPAGSKTIGRGAAGRLFVRDASSKAAPWKRQVAQAAGEAMGGRSLLAGPLELAVIFHVHRPKAHYRGKSGTLREDAPTYPTSKPDSTKLLRAVEDALTGVVWRDDGQVSYQVVLRLYTESQARAVIRVDPMRTGRDFGLPMDLYGGSGAR